MFIDSRSRDPLPKVWDENTRIGDMLKGKRGLVVGVANADSIAMGCAAKLRGFGAEIALTYLNDKARKFVEPLAQQIDASLLLPHAVHLALLAAVAVGVMNVQVATRLLCAGCPLLYWHAAGLWVAADDAAAMAACKKGDDGDVNEGKARSPHRLRWDFRHAYAAWGVGYSLVGGALFALFLPWT